MTKEQMEQIVQQNMQKIYRYCIRRLKSVTEAEDVASDIILELLRSYARIKEDGAVYGYMWSVADNLCKNHWRKSAKYEHGEIPEDYAGICMMTPEECFLQNEDISLLRRELSLLGEKYRKIMVEYYVKEKSCEEIARQMQISVTNVKQYLFEGRKKIRGGMDMQREYGIYSYAPEKFSMNFWGDSSKGYWELFRRKLPGSIMLAVYDKPRTMEELSLEVGVTTPYLEEEVAILENFELLVKRGKKYHSNMVIYSSEWTRQMHEEVKGMLEERINIIKEMVDKGVLLLQDTDYCHYRDDLNVRRWFVLMLIFWEAMQLAEGKMKTRLTFPLLANGSKGYVMGMRGDFPADINGMNGIYGKYSLKNGYMRILNYKLLSDKILPPFENQCWDILTAAEARETETEELEVLSELMERGFVRIEEEKVYPCYAEISEKDCCSLKEKLADEIDYIAGLAAEHRDKAGKELEKITPRDIPFAKEVGSIVSMWSMLEKIVPVMLEDGYMEKGKEGQNVTIFYFKN